MYNAVADADPNTNHDPTTNSDPTLTLSLTLIINSTHSMIAQIMCNQDF